jgi:hypothetical protein
MCVPAFAQIDVAPYTDEYRIATAVCTTEKPKDGRIRYRWSADPGVCLVPSATGKLCYITARKGEYTLILTVATASPTDLTLTDYTAQITFGDTPTPDPVPDPEPPPVVAKKLWLVAVDDPAQRSPNQMRIITDVALWKELLKSGHDFEAYATSSVEGTRYKPYLKYAAQLILQDATTGKVLGVEEFPKIVDREWVKAIVAKYTGVNP